jgi:hypothetical protein
MKIAILISGEYRTFPICRKTMPFLNDERVDVYVSTWDKSIVKNERLNLDINDTITEDGVRNDLKIPATILIEPEECFVSRRYNDKMIHRWLSGFAMIKNSGIEYDYVLVMRPDLYFNIENNFNLNSLLDIKENEMRVAWHSGSTPFLQDNMFAMPFGKMKQLSETLTVDLWVNQEDELDWHKWWTTFINGIFFELNQLCEWEKVSFCRSMAKDGDSWATVRQLEDVWRDCGIVNWVEKFNDTNGPIAAWGEKIVNDALSLRDSGFFKRYENTFRVAILISGEYRTFKTCRKTMKFLDDPDVDVYFSTWDTSHVLNKRLNVDVFQNINLDKIKEDLLPVIPVNISLGNLKDEKLGEAKAYGLEMINRWINGIKLIKESKKHYDWIMIVRPDIFVNDVDTFSGFKTDLNNFSNSSLLTAWSDINNQSLGDFLFLSSQENIEKLITEDMFNNWKSKIVEGDIHKWLFEYTNSIVKDILPTPNCLNSFDIHRFESGEENSIELCAKHSWYWEEAKRINAIVHHNGEPMNDKWNIQVGVKNTSINSEKVAVVISGMLRNYDAALLSLPIWGEADRYLVTWESAGQEKMDDYIKKAGIKQSFVIKDSEFGNVYADGSAINNFCRMVYLWQQIFYNVPNDYNKYVIVRPDGFYWCTSKEDIKKCLISEMPFKTNQFRHSEIYGMGDHMFFINKSHISKFKTIFNDVTLELLKMHALNNHNADGHVVLYNAFRQNINEELFGTDDDMCSSELDRVIDTVFVRDTFNLLPSDKYDWKLYKAIYCDTASWWRNKHCHSYEGYLRPQLPDQK